MKNKVLLSEVAEIIMGQSPDSLSCNKHGEGLPFLQGCGEFGKTTPIIVNYCTAPKKIAPRSSILISVRAPVGDINIANQDVVIGRGLAGIVAKDIDQEFLYYSILYFKRQLQKVSQGSTFEAINSSDLHNFEINYFPPLQQRKIARILSTCDLAIENNETAISKYKAIQQGLMHDVFTRGIDTQTGQLRPKFEDSPELYKRSKLGLVPNDWDVERLDSIIEAIDPQPDHRTPLSVENGVPYLGINDIDTLGNIDFQKCRKVSKRVLEEHKKRYQVRSGDIIFGKIGTIGEPKRLVSVEEFTLSANVILIQPKENSSYIYWLLKSAIVNRQIVNSIHTTSQPAFGMEKIRALLVPLCVPSEQRLISEKLGTLEALINVEQSALEKHKQLKEGLMRDLLTGKIEVETEEFQIL